MYVCPTCGAGLVFDPKTQKLQCMHCRNKFDPENIENMKLDKAKEFENQGNDLKQNEYEAISYKCSHCGAELITTDETITTFCSFCRTGTMLDRKIIKKTKPDYVIPFTKTKEECEKIYVDKIKKSFFAPKSMIDTQEVQKIRGIYMPYWIYSFEKHGTTSAKGSRYSHRSGDYVYYDDYSLVTDVNAECSGIIHDATSNFSDRLSESIAPFSVKEKKEFSASYLSGYYADNEDVENKVYKDECESIASKHITSKLEKESIYRKYGAKPKVNLNTKSAELALFPVYFLATKNRTGDRISYAVINGQTGKIAADIPIDFKKFVLFSLLLSIPIYFLLNLFVTVSMPVLIMLSIIFNIISVIVLSRQDKKITFRENDLDDKGMQSKKAINNETYKNKEKKDKKGNNALLMWIIIGIIACAIIAPILIVLFQSIIENYTFFGWGIIVILLLFTVIRLIKHPERDMSFCKPMIGLIITILVFVLKPAEDMYYYIAAFISISMAMWSFYNIIQKINILTTRKLPQLGKRGGDENA